VVRFSELHCWLFSPVARISWLTSSDVEISDVHALSGFWSICWSFAIWRALSQLGSHSWTWYVFCLLMN
jgi:hypothetical protein